MSKPIICRIGLPLPGRGRVDPGRGPQTGVDQARSGVDPARVRLACSRLNPGVAASAGVAAVPGSTLSPAAVVVLVVAVVLVLGIAASAPGRARRSRRAGRATRRPHRAPVIAVLIMAGAVLGATVTGGQIAHALVAALVAIGHALIGLLP